MSQKTVNASSWLFKASLLSLSLLAQTAPSISIANTQLAQQFPNVSQSSIELISTLPNFSVLILILFAEAIGNKFGIKRTILFGLGLYTIGGVLPALVSSFPVIIAARLLMGLGIGLFNPYSVSLMYRFYEGQQLKGMLGFQNTAQNLGNAAFGFLLSALIISGWRTAFTGFFVGLIPLILIWLFVTIPDDKGEMAEQAPAKASFKEAVNGHILLLALLFLITFAMFLMMTIKMAVLGQETGLFSPSAASSILALLGLASMVAALLYAPVSKLIGNFILPVSFTGIAAGFFIVANANSVATVTTGVVIAGIFFGWVFPQAFLRVAQVGPKNGGTLTTSVILMGINLGAAFAAPMVNAVAGLFGMSSVTGVLSLVGIGFTVLAIIEYIYNFFDRKPKN
ncbi:MFS transporter [Streptococcus loxodontisalivarius]|uniref:MFS family arabinose efflux permease n=1 Tax=Streptococcus loxodontisalivarius TaxID=1349415 RepID=A0ABS2PRI4_9STRE|nr:MFS transporter [Streptococcus loxodontisalivarius]MBM7642536.1 putative MFS family arabinose efflux permease [Streptococcus loxodontisalivarius]